MTEKDHTDNILPVRKADEPIKAVVMLEFTESELKILQHHEEQLQGAAGLLYFLKTRVKAKKGQKEEMERFLDAIVYALANLRLILKTARGQ
jgi:hypothetical protein